MNAKKKAAYDEYVRDRVRADKSRARLNEIRRKIRVGGEKIRLFVRDINGKIIDILESSK